MGLRDEQLLLFDGSCGVSLQALDLPPAIWGDRYSLEVKQPIVRARILELVYYLRGIQTD